MTQATITTTAIEVAVLRVGRKQMTKAVFRQLVRDDSITGPIWGWVNVHDQHCDLREHRHVIWQDELGLRHAVLERPPSEEAQRRDYWLAIVEELVEWGFPLWVERADGMAQDMTGFAVDEKGELVREGVFGGLFAAGPGRYATAESYERALRTFHEDWPGVLARRRQWLEHWEQASSTQLFIAV